MKTELLLRIKAAEDDARQGIQQAEAEAKKIVAEARRQAEAILSDGREQAEHAYSQRIDAARAKADAQAKDALQAGHEKAEALRASFEAELPAATQRVLKLFEERI